MAIPIIVAWIEGAVIHNVEQDDHAALLVIESDVESGEIPEDEIVTLEMESEIMPNRIYLDRYYAMLFFRGKHRIAGGGETLKYDELLIRAHEMLGRW